MDQNERDHSSLLEQGPVGPSREKWFLEGIDQACCPFYLSLLRCSFFMFIFLSVPRELHQSEITLEIRINLHVTNFEDIIYYYRFLFCDIIWYTICLKSYDTYLCETIIIQQSLWNSNIFKNYFWESFFNIKYCIESENYSWLISLSMQYSFVKNILENNSLKVLFSNIFSI